MIKQTPSVIVVVLSTAALFAQTPPSFEVATIKIHSFARPDRGGPPTIAGNRFVRGGNLHQLIMYAWDVKGYQLAGGPDWVTHPSLDHDYFDIEAKAEGDATLTEPRARQLLQQLLVNRFHLMLHKETKEMPVYALVVGKGGPKLKESTPDETAATHGFVNQTTVTSSFTKSSIDDFLRVLSGATDRPVINQTGLTGLYDFKLEFTRDPATAPADSETSSVFTAVQDQLGLKLEPRKSSVDILVIDQAQKPSAN